MNKIIFDSENPKVGIISTGKSFLDTKLGLEKIGINEDVANQIGIKFLKIAMPWPLEETIIENFAESLEKIIVVEEKRSIIETPVSYTHLTLPTSDLV